MVKLYVICLDAFPEIPELSAYLTDMNFQRSDLVCCGAFTCATMTSMISGNLGSEIIPSDNNQVNVKKGLVEPLIRFEGGIGYNTMYQKKFIEWRKSGHCLTDRVDVMIHNHVSWMSNVIGGKQLSEEEKTKHYRDRTVTDENVKIYPFGITRKEGSITYSSSNPDMTLNTFVKWNFDDCRKNFYENETKYIKYIQNKKFHGMFWTDLCHWHEYVYYPSGQQKNNNVIKQEDALNNSVAWLKKWDFNEPDTFFFIYADHSHRVTAYLDPPSYLTWVYYKDNIVNKPLVNKPLVNKLPVNKAPVNKSLVNKSLVNKAPVNKIKLNDYISSADFYHLAEKIFSLPYIDRSKWSVDPSVALPDRIFACEDSRAKGMLPNEATTFLRGCRYENLWLSVAKIKSNDLIPEGIYITIADKNNIHTHTVYRYTENLSKCIESYSIECTDGLAERKKIDKKIFEISNIILKKIKQMMNTF